MADSPPAVRPWPVLVLGRLLLVLLALAVSVSDGRGAPVWLVSALALAVGASILERTVASGLVMVLETLLAALIVGLGSPDSIALLPYLLVPAFGSGLIGGIGVAALAGAAAMVGLTAGLSSSGQGDLREALPIAPQWSALVLAAALVGAWTQRQQDDPSLDSERYEAAARLLSRLQDVTRRLSGGLDEVTIAETLLSESMAVTGAHRGAVFALLPSGELSPLSSESTTPGWLNEVEDDAVINRARRSGSVVVGRLGGDRRRFAAALVNNTREVGILVLDAEEGDPERRALSRLSRIVDDAALRLDTALLFADIREQATREERRRLAREIHDGIAQELASLGYLTDDLASRSMAPSVRTQVQLVQSELRRIVSELRLSIYDLRSGVGADTSLGATIAEYARKAGATSRLAVHLVLDESTRRLRPEVEGELLRIAQEAITNVRKHAGAHTMWVEVKVSPPTALVSVADDGRGLGSPGPSSYGMDIMKERADRAGGSLSVTESEQGGTVVTVRVGGQPALLEGSLRDDRRRFG